MEEGGGMSIFEKLRDEPIFLNFFILLGTIIFLTTIMVIEVSSPTQVTQTCIVWEENEIVDQFDFFRYEEYQDSFKFFDSEGNFLCEKHRKSAEGRVIEIWQKGD
jgi:hypothetical protein